MVLCLAELAGPLGSISRPGHQMFSHVISFSFHSILCGKFKSNFDFVEAGEGIP